MQKIILSDIDQVKKKIRKLFNVLETESAVKFLSKRDYTELLKIFQYR